QWGQTTLNLYSLSQFPPQRKRESVRKPYRSGKAGQTKPCNASACACRFYPGRRTQNGKENHDGSRGPDRRDHGGGGRGGRRDQGQEHPQDEKDGQEGGPRRRARGAGPGQDGRPVLSLKNHASSVFSQRGMIFL